jgi:hypothetical protein
MSTATHPVRRPRFPRRAVLFVAALIVVVAAAITVPLLLLGGGSSATPAPAPAPVVHTAPLQPAPDPCQASTIGRPRPC